MARRKNEEPPVSLFAFQDIITSITGIMILVVLLLILDIIKADPTQKHAGPSPLNKEIQDLKKIELQLQQAIEKAKQWRDKNMGFIEKILKTNLEQLPKLIAKEKQKADTFISLLKDLHDKTKLLKQRAKQLSDEKDELDEEAKSLVVLIDQADGEKKQMEHELSLLLKKIKELQKQKEERKNQVEFVIDQSLNKSPIFVECSKDTIKVKLLKPENRILEPFVDESDNIMLLRKFYTWLKTNQSADKTYLILMVKPNSVEYVSKLMILLEKDGFQFALEPMETGKTGIY